MFFGGPPLTGPPFINTPLAAGAGAGAGNPSAAFGTDWGWTTVRTSPCCVTARDIRPSRVATRFATECKVATFSFRCFPSMLPTATAVICPSSPASIHLTGPVRKYRRLSGSGEIVRQSRTSESRLGISLHSNASWPPYFLGMFSMSMNCVRVGRT